MIVIKAKWARYIIMKIKISLFIIIWYPMSTKYFYNNNYHNYYYNNKRVEFDRQIMHERDRYRHDRQTINP